MPQFIVLIASKNDVPANGETGAAMVYRGDHTDEPEAVEAAANALGLGTNDRLWATTAASLTRYVCTTTTDRSTAAG